MYMSLAVRYGVGGDAKELPHVISIALLLTILMMLLMPLISKDFKIPDAIASVWTGSLILLTVEKRYDCKCIAIFPHHIGNELKGLKDRA